MKKEERSILIRKIVIIVFLVMLIIGFTVPSLLDMGGEQNKINEPRICKNDAECYLLCEDKPVAVLCSQNLCVQNGCEESSLYAYNTTPVTFSLAINIKGEEQDLINRTNSQDMFVKFNSQQVQMYSSGMSLKQVLEKANILLNSQCLTLNQTYCTTTEKELKLLVNKNVTYTYENYVPQEGDKIELIYS
ncbi:MAG: hypothetical protein V2A62_05515 [Candidatus Woesearchaeota archaeon]